MKKNIYFAGGCFWGVEKYFSCIPGVTETRTGYANGRTQAPTYEDVCIRNTGHAEAVQVTYDADKTNLPLLLSMFYKIIDPTSVDGQGPDVGTQYRSGVYYTDKADKPVIDASLKELQKEYDKPLAVEVQPLQNFYPAEQYHQKYLDKNPNGYCHIGKESFEYAKNAKVLTFQKKSQHQLKELLTELEYNVTQNNITERAYENKYYDNFRDGIYVDITTGQPLFVSTDKFESGCGWPSFSKPIDPTLLKEVSDKSYRMNRTEVRSKTGDAHLGHVFCDGPGDLGGMRYCINSASLRFIPKEEMRRQGYAFYLPLLDR